MTDPVWRTSSFTDNGTCVAVADLGGHVVVRNSNRPEAGTLTFSVANMRAFIAACRAGEFDDLA